MNYSSSSLPFSVFLLLAIALPTSALAGPGHHHDHDHSKKHSHNHKTTPPKKLDTQGLIAAASKGVATLVKGKNLVEGQPLGALWAETPEESKTVSKTGPGFSIIRFRNKDKSLFVLVSDNGEIYDANFSGKFEDLKK